MVEKRLLNNDWFFVKLPVGSTMEDLKSAAWQAVQLPHDWLIWQADNLYESADAWYRRELMADELKAACALLAFDGVYMDCDVLLNGEILCSHAYGYTSFTVDLTGHIQPGRNELLVHIRHRSPNSRWYSGSGIYRDVTLLRLDEDHIIPDSLRTVTEETDDGWELRLEMECAGSGEVQACLLDQEDRIIGQAQGPVEDGRVRLRMTIYGGERWEPDHPYLYQLKYAMGTQHECCRIGFRTLKFDPETGFWINGKNLKLKGVCNHHDLGALGAAFHVEAARRQLRIMQSMGVNALRTSHNPPARQLLDLCDEMGILVVDEIFDMWERPKTEFDYARFFPEHEAEDVALWVRRDRNHPCVIMWSIGNEIYDMFADSRGAEVCRMLMKQVQEHDPDQHAAVTFGSNYMPWEGAQHCAEIVKIPGYNYAEKYYADHHQKHPDWVIYGSETASVLSSRGIYHFPADKTILSESDLQCSSLGNSVSSWGAADLGRMIVEDLNCEYSMGQFVWSGFDYIGEPTPYHTRSCYFGQVDTAGFPKDSFYLFQSLWTDRPMIHIGVYWDWNPGQLIDVRVMSNCASVELKLNGRSLGCQTLDRRDPEKCIARWRVPYEPGEMIAIGYDIEDREICTDSRQSFGDTEALLLTSEKESLLADGSDLTFITVQAVDRMGTPVENARDRLCVEVAGGGVLMGLDNGDSSDTDEYKGCSKRLFNGKLLMIVGSSGENKPTSVSVRNTAGCSSTLIIPSIPAKKIADNSLNAVPCTDLHGDGHGDIIPVRKVEIIPLDSNLLTDSNREARFAWKLYPENADPVPVRWALTTATGIPSSCAELSVEDGVVRVLAKGDGEVCLRALCGNSEDGHPELISQLVLSITGIGNVNLDPYEFVSAGLYDQTSGDIGAGNEKGIAFARESGASMVGFSRLDFGPSGSSRITMDIFALDGNPYEIRLYDGNPEAGGKLIHTMTYQKPSIWNVYQSETWDLPVKLKGIHTLCFEADHKFHFKGFRFEKPQLSGWHEAGSADSISGDSFRMEDQDSAVREIGNNVSLVWNQIDTGNQEMALLAIAGKTPLDVNAVTVLLAHEDGRENRHVLRFMGNGQPVQTFPIAVPTGICRVTFIFLPGSQFDFEGFSLEGTSD